MEGQPVTQIPEKYPVTFCHALISMSLFNQLFWNFPPLRISETAHDSSILVFVSSSLLRRQCKKASVRLTPGKPSCTFFGDAKILHVNLKRFGTTRPTHFFHLDLTEPVQWLSSFTGNHGNHREEKVSDAVITCFTSKAACVMTESVW